MHQIKQESLTTLNPILSSKPYIWEFFMISSYNLEIFGTLPSTRQWRDILLTYTTVVLLI